MSRTTCARSCSKPCAAVLGAVFMLGFLVRVPSAFADGDSVPPAPKEEGEASRPDSAAGGKVKLAFWNIEKFGENKTAAQIDIMARVMSDKKYDVLAIEEVKKKKGPQDLRDAIQNLTHGHYGLIVTPLTGGTTQQRESYAFIYNEATIELINGGKFAATAGITRSPYYARFACKNAGAKRFDFIMMAIHTKPDPTSTLWDDLRGISKAYKDTYNGNKKAPVNEDELILGGDFNLWPGKAGYDAAFPSPPFTSTLQTPTASMIQVKGTKLNDNIVFNEIVATEDYDNSTGVDDFDIQYFSDPNDAKGVSDHRPVWAVFKNDNDSH